VSAQDLATKKYADDSIAALNIGAYQLLSQKAQPSGYASLDSSTLVPVAQLPTATTSAKGVAELATSAETTAGLVVQASDTRLSDARTPTGSAGGVLTGTYPNPTFNTSTVSSFALTFLDDTTAAQVRTTIGAGTGNGTVTSVGASSPIASSGGTTPSISLSTGTYGDIVVSAATTWTVGNAAISNAKLAAMNSQTVKGNSTGGSATPTDINMTDLRTMIGIVTAAVSGLVPDTPGSNTSVFLGDSTWGQVLTGAIADATSTSTGVTLAKLQWLPPATLIGRSNSGSGATQNLGIGASLDISAGGTMTRAAFTGGDVTASQNSNVLTIVAGAVTLAKMADLAAATVIGRHDASTGVPQAVPVGDGLYCSAGLLGMTNLGVTSAKLAARSATFAKVQAIAADRILGRVSAGPGDIEELTTASLASNFGMVFTGSSPDFAQVQVTTSGGIVLKDSTGVGYHRIVVSSAGVLSTAAFP
jgi:hypothetical protein